MKFDISIFENMSDDDFFSNKFTHLYFNEDVEHKYVTKLINEITLANKVTVLDTGAILNPKPILIHISSHGGSVTAGMRLLSIFALSNVPILTIIDNYAASAATFLSINSHYRLINNYGYCLLHDYSAVISGKKEKIIQRIKLYEKYFSKIIEMYKNKTKFENDELIELLQHDLILDSNYCLEKGIVDRIIKIEKKIKKIKKNININKLLENNNNIISFTCDKSLEKFDKILFQENLAPIIIYPRRNNCDDTKKYFIFSKDEEDIEPDKEKPSIFRTLNIIPRILSISSPIYAIIDGPISIDDLLPMLFCDHIFMFDYAYIVNNILNYYNKSSLLLSDNIKNTNTIFNIIKDILKEKTNMTNEMIDDINNKFSIIDVKEAKELGMCHSIINL